MNDKISITLPSHMVEALNERVDAGAYASINEAVAAAIQALGREESARNRMMDARIREAIDDESAGIPANDVFERIERLHTDRLKKSGR
ncbi:antitoxin ParD1/3/4 [Neorhizobium huautlense]|uniref:Antitoxin ParD1/3/4 n=1 Tax=Neorhizobium huautlense TaxID=67774 RepID=A0ABT9PSP9_9HYPH|nr:type II toxin-antitoxin system ParD family antitoxin [Neorhizobium huautlense]MDP9837479.1 antitoxin ParD1/3/4 [Neorhizobium huautlense]